MLPFARRALDEAAACLLAARQGVASIDLVLGTRQELGMSWLVPMESIIADALPHVRLHIYFGASTDLERGLIEHRLDAAVSSHATSTARLDSALLHREDYVFVASPALLSHTPLVTHDDATRHALLDIDASLPLYRYCQFDANTHRPLRFASQRHMGTIDAVRYMVLAQRGVAVLPLYFVQPQLDDGSLTRILPSLPLAHDHFRLLYRPDSPTRAIILKLAEIMREQPLR
jgi:DNA-binding transcriptional LysR family regulator